MPDRPIDHHSVLARLTMLLLATFALHHGARGQAEGERRPAPPEGAMTMKLRVIQTGSEDGARPTIFRVSRTGDASTSVLVNYTVGGETKPGADFVAPSGELLLPARTTSADAEVLTLNDGYIEPHEDQTITLLRGASCGLFREHFGPAPARDWPAEQAARAELLPRALGEALRCASVWDDGREGAHRRRYRIDGLAWFGRSNGRMRAKVLVPPDLRQRMGDRWAEGYRSLLDVEASEGIWTLSRTTGWAWGSEKPAMRLACYDPREQGELVVTSLWANEDGFMLAGHSPHAAGHGNFAINLIARADGVVISQHVAADTGERDFDDPKEMARLPDRVGGLTRSRSFERLLDRFAARTSAADAYRAFPEIEADAEMSAVASKHVAKLDAPDAAEREAATDELRRLGRSGVAALVRMPRAGLSPEQEAAVARLIDEEGLFSAGDAMAAARDWRFLIDCLHDPDVRLRRAARDALYGLDHRDARYDPEAPPHLRAAAADAWRARIVEKIQEAEREARELQRRP